MANSLKRLRLLVPAKFDRFFAHSNRRGVVSSALVFCLLLLSRVTLAQSSTVTTLTATAAGPVSGSIVTMTANVSSGGQPVTGGTVTFRDTYGGAAQNLGTVQVQSANGTPGLAILKTGVGGVGGHSIVAIYNAPKAYSTSTSTPVPITFQSPYSSATALAVTGSGGSYTLTGTVSAFGPVQPTGSVTFTDTTPTPNIVIGTAQLNPATATQGFTPPTLYQIPTSSPWSTYSTGTPVSGDFNGDGYPDFAIPTSLGPVIIMLGHGDGTFQQGPSISAAQPFGAVAGDFNGDGILDLAVGNEGTNGSIAIYLGKGDGTFQVGAVYPAVPNAAYQTVALGDFNRDGIPDLVVSDHANNQVAVLLGNGDGTFQVAGTFSTAYEPWNIAVGDINGDGNPDLVIADDINDAQGKNITILLGNGDGTFSQGTYLVGGVTSSGSVALADFNGDGILDIAATEEPANSVFVFLGNGDGTFQPKSTYAMNTGPYYITIGDFNQDGKKDIITANAEGQSIGVLLGNGDGTFQAAKTFPTTSREAIYVDVQDFNGDNQVDVVAVTHEGLQVYLAGDAQTAQFSPFTVTGCGTHSIIATYSSDANYAASTSPVESVSQSGISTTLSVAPTPQNPVWNQTVTLTATLTPYVNGSNSSDTEPVSFYDGTTLLGSGQLTKGVAAFTVTSLAMGPHSFSAVYGGDCALTGSTSLAILATVGKASPTITWANPASISYGTQLSPTQLNATASVPGSFAYTPDAGTVPPAGNDTLSVTFTPTDSTHYATTTTTVPISVSQGALTITAQNATRAYGAPNPTFLGAVTGAAPGDTFTETFTTTATSTSAPGTYAIVPSVTGTNVANYTQSVTNGTLTVTQASATVSITPTPTAASPTQTVSLSANVVSATSGTPTGTVTFFNNGNALGTATLSGGTATYPAGTLPLGNNVITASYSGDTNFTSATASAVTVTVAQNVLSINANNATRAYGAANPTFTGSITGAQNGDTFTESFATTATATSAPGTYPIVPSAAGANLSQYQQSVTNGTLTITPAPLSVTAADASRVYGTPNPTFSGNITGQQNGDTFTESFSTTATATSAPGTYPIVPTASGANLADYQPSPANGTLTINKAAVNTAISLSAPSITQGQNETVTATVKSTTTGTPTGTVTFLSGSTQLGTATLSNGTATYSTSSLPVGNDIITFTYSGDTNFAAITVGQSSGTTGTVAVSAPTPLDFSFSMSSSSGLSGVYGGSVPVTLHIAPTAGQYPGTVQFSTSGTPAVAATYSFSPATLAANAGAQDVTMTIQLQALTGMNRTPATSGRLAPIALGLLFLPWLTMRRMRKSGEKLGKSLGLSAMFLVVLGAATLSMTGCGGGGTTPTGTTNPQPVSDSIVVNASSGSVQHSVTVTLTVQKAQ